MVVMPERKRKNKNQGTWSEAARPEHGRSYAAPHADPLLTDKGAQRQAFSDYWGGVVENRHGLAKQQVDIAQQDIDLDKAAWDFTQERYDRFGQHSDQHGLAQSALATSGIAGDMGFDMADDFWSPYEGILSERPPEYGPGVTARQRQRRPTDPGVRSRGDAPDMAGLETYQLPRIDMPQAPQSGGGGITNIATPRPAEGGSQFTRDWNAAYDWFGDTFNLPQVEDFIRKAPGRAGRGIKDYFTR